MTDKQIIIDGVDVSGCCAYSKHREGYCGWYTPCEGDSCSYKLEWALEQLKAKEQECEELKKQVDITQMFLDACNNSCEHYKQTLTEIKEIAEILIPMTDEYDNCYYKDRCDKCEVKEDCQYFKVEQILQKLSEVLDGKNS